MIDQELKKKCHILRESGKSYNYISHETGVSKSILSHWFAGNESSEEVKKLNNISRLQASKDLLLAYHTKRRQQLKQKEFMTILEAQKDFARFKSNSLFMVGIMLYASQGDIASRQNFRLSNSNPALCLIFMRFIAKYFKGIASDRVKLQIIAYENHSTKSIEAYWLRMLGIGPENLHKTQVIKGRKNCNKLPYGIGNVSISSRYAKIRILEFIRLGTKVLSQ